MERVHVVARLFAHPHTAEALGRALTTLLVPTRAEAGCLRYELVQRQDDPTEWTFLETWTSQEALDAHQRSPHIAALSLAGLLARPSEILFYRDAPATDP